MLIRQALFTAFGIGLLTTVGAVAETSTRVGEYTIHHTAMTTDTLDPEVAKANGILRSKFRGMLNVTVIKNQSDTRGHSTVARVEVNASEPNGLTSRIPMREIKMQDDVYYIGEFPVKNLQILNFDIQVTPAKTAETHHVHLEQQFFIE